MILTAVFFFFFAACKSDRCELWHELPRLLLHVVLASVTIYCYLLHTKYACCNASRKVTPDLLFPNNIDKLPHDLSDLVHWNQSFRRLALNHCLTLQVQMWKSK